jgi:hypothetical protein
MNATYFGRALEFWREASPGEHYPDDRQGRKQDFN